MKTLNKQRVAGWVAVVISTLITCLWAFWGIIENFHEGWYFASWWSNLGLMFLQYLSPMLLFMSLTLVAIFWPRVGGVLHVLLGMLALWFFRGISIAATFFIILPLVGLGVLYWFGRPLPRKRAAALAVGLPLLTLLISGIAPAIRVAQRVDDGDRGARRVVGNGVDLFWAPAGPGWPATGDDWDAAGAVCRHLDEDGQAVSTTPQEIWRLPTVAEAVRSQARHGENSGGTWDPDMAQATYATTPDKETPLWDVHSPVIYWWTATEIDAENAYIIAYNGKVWPREKDIRPDYLGFRCVRPPDP